MMANIAEDIADSWEELEDSGELDKRLQDIKTSDKKIRVLPSRGKKKQQAMSSFSTRDVSSASTPGVTPMLQEDSTRTQYQPQVKILRRQPKDDDQNSAAAKNNGQKPMKTLEQREAEYAEARMRIFGSANPDLPSPEQIEAAIGNGEPESIPERPPRLLQQMDELRLSENNVARQPIGPDGSKGFNMPR